jgi:acyl-CoA hydrolase
MSEVVKVENVDACVERILAACGDHIVLAAPLGLGKPNRLINALYRHVAADPACRLTIHTALSLDLPQASGDIERRFAEPFLRRQFGADYPRLDYVAAMRADRLPANIRVHEFYFQSGAMLTAGQAQRDYASLNYTLVARDLVRVGIKVIVQLVARRGTGDEARYSLSCNPDVTLDLLDRMVEEGAPRPLLVGVVHPQLPFLGGEADVGAERFDLLLDEDDPPQRLFGLPREDVDEVEHAIGLHASTLVRDGGTLQIGIGALSDALVHALLLRHKHNADYREALRDLRAEDTVDTGLIARIGGLDPFARGVYGSSEMIMDGFMHLRLGGVLQRHVYDDLALQRALDAGAIGETLQQGDAQRLRVCGVLPSRLDLAEVARLVKFGILPPGASSERDGMRWPDGKHIDADLDDPAVLADLDRLIRGRRLRGGRYLQGGFCLGSRELYDWLGALEGGDYDGLAMSRISEVNQFKRGDETLAAVQRREARFFNTCMMATALGAAVSDAIEDGRVVSGVGGQYNFVAMAHALDDGRSILMLRSTRRERGKLTSNIRWNYGHTTIPRHLRDIFVTEYGIADLRGKTDEECVVAMLAISDAQFHAELVAAAVQARKLPHDFSIPPAWARNTRAELVSRQRAASERGVLPKYPFGSDFDAVEQRLLAALSWLKRASASPSKWAQLFAAALIPGEADTEALARMALDRPATLRERVFARALKGALNRT